MRLVFLLQQQQQQGAPSSTVFTFKQQPPTTFSGGFPDDSDENKRAMKLTNLSNIILFTDFLGAGITVGFTLLFRTFFFTCDSRSHLVAATTFCCCTMAYVSLPTPPLFSTCVTLCVVYLSLYLFSSEFIPCRIYILLIYKQSCKGQRIEERGGKSQSIYYSIKPTDTCLTLIPSWGTPFI